MKFLRLIPALFVSICISVFFFAYKYMPDLSNINIDEDVTDK